MLLWLVDVAAAAVGSVFGSEIGTFITLILISQRKKKETLLSKTECTGVYCERNNSEHLPHLRIFWVLVVPPRRRVLVRMPWFSFLVSHNEKGLKGVLILLPRCSWSKSLIDACQLGTRAC